LDITLVLRDRRYCGISDPASGVCRENPMETGVKPAICSGMKTNNDRRHGLDLGLERLRPTRQRNHQRFLDAQSNRAYRQPAVDFRGQARWPPYFTPAEKPDGTIWAWGRLWKCFLEIRGAEVHAGAFPGLHRQILAVNFFRHFQAAQVRVGANQ
jgi:hypothetical protein